MTERDFRKEFEGKIVYGYHWDELGIDLEFANDMLEEIDRLRAEVERLKKED